MSHRLCPLPHPSDRFAHFAMASWKPREGCRCTCGLDLTGCGECFCAARFDDSIVDACCAFALLPSLVRLALASASRRRSTPVGHSQRGACSDRIRSNRRPGDLRHTRDVTSTGISSTANCLRLRLLLREIVILHGIAVATSIIQRFNTECIPICTQSSGMGNVLPTLGRGACSLELTTTSDV